MHILDRLFHRPPSPPAPKNAIVYDCEIVRAMPVPGVAPDPTLEYCGGWTDFEGMGISCICAYDFATDGYRVFLSDNLADFQTLVHKSEEVIGFNSISFDDRLCAANNIQIKTTYDLQREVWVAAEMPPEYTKGVTRRGYSLGKIAQVNLGSGKDITGAIAPELWQRGKIGTVIDYCLKDVMITKKLYEKRHHLIDPTNAQVLKLRS